MHLWAAEETGATEAPRSVAAAGDVEQEEGAGTRDARTREAPGEEAARTKRGTGRRSTSASTGWQNGWSDSKKRCASCAAAVPGLLILLAALASLAGAQVVVFAVLVPWRLATSFVAVERALGVGRAKSAVALLLGVVCGLVLVRLGTVMLLNVLT